MREEQLGMTARAVVDVLDALDAGGTELCVGDRAKVEHAPVGRVLVAGERIDDLRPHLVAAGADARADGGGTSQRICGRRIAFNWRRAAFPISPPARPRQPQCSMATAPPPAIATGRQSATSTSAASPGSVVK